MEERREKAQSSMEMATEASSVMMGDLISSLEQATLMAKQLPNTIQPSHLNQIYTTLHSTHLHLTTFLTHYPNPTPPPENSLSSAVGGGGGVNEIDTDEPMQIAEDENEAERNSKNSTIDSVEERMRECFIQNKRPKRPLSPSSAAAEQRRSYENEALYGQYGGSVAEFDPQGTKLRALDLVYQFHS